MGEGAFTWGDRGDMEIPDVGWCLGSLCWWIGVVIGVIGKFLMWDGVEAHCVGGLGW